ncbi:MAG TPA: hypothetical protein VJ865_02370 [Gemmatimonadaceae bacterium]|nr:hypothetical protein [Gemmatimonadaceae bacterium]
MRSVLSAVGVALVVGGCASSTDPNVAAGVWHQEFGNIPGNSFQMTLFPTASGIGGTGFGCGEAGPCTTSNISGTVDGRTVHLTIITMEDVPAGGNAIFTEQFDGFVLPTNMLVGKLRQTGPSAEVGLVYDVTYRRTPKGVAELD